MPGYLQVIGIGSVLGCRHLRTAETVLADEGSSCYGGKAQCFCLVAKLQQSIVVVAVSVYHSYNCFRRCTVCPCHFQSLEALHCANGDSSPINRCGEDEPVGLDIDGFGTVVCREVDKLTGFCGQSFCNGFGYFTGSMGGRVVHHAYAAVVLFHKKYELVISRDTKVMDSLNFEECFQAIV